MDIKKIAASAASVLLMFCAAGSFRSFAPKNSAVLTASADYEFEYIGDDDAEDMIEDFAAENDDLYETGSYSSDERAVERQFSPVRSFFISLIIGLIIAFAVVSMMRSSMKSVRQKSGASDYRKQDGFNLSVKTDDHLGTKVEKTAIPKAQPPQAQRK